MNQTLRNTLWSVDRSPRGRLVIAGCSSGLYLSQPIVNRLNILLPDEYQENTVPFLENIDFRFSDSEIGVRLGADVSGCDVFLLQALYDPIGNNSISDNYLTLCIATRTFREWGANSITVLVPYLTYARQDKPTRFQREPTTAKLMADLLITSGINRLVTWHPHYQQIHGFFSGVPVDVLEGLDYFADIFQAYQGRDDVILVAPDIGASNFTTHLGRLLDLQVAIAAKYHPEREQTEISEVIGDLRNKQTALIVDDMMSSGGTLYKVVKQLVEDYHINQVHLAVSHNLCTETAYERLVDMHENYFLQSFCVTNSIPQTEKFVQLPFVKVHDLTDSLVNTIKHIHYSLS